VVVNAELHTLADGATPDYKYQGGKGDQGYFRCHGLSTMAG
jgi:hypothetical protein